MDHNLLLGEERDSIRRSVRSNGVALLFFVLGIMIGIGSTGWLNLGRPPCEILVRPRRNLQNNETIESAPLHLCRQRSNTLKEKLITCEAMSKNSSDELMALDNRISAHDREIQGYLLQIGDFETKINVSENLLAKNAAEIASLKEKLATNDKRLHTSQDEIKKLKQMIVVHGKNFGHVTAENKKLKQKFVILLILHICLNGLTADERNLNLNKIENNRLKQTLTNTEKALNASMAERNDLKERLATNEAGLNCNCIETEKLKQRLVDQENLLASKNQEIEKLEQKKIETDKRITYLGERITTLNEQPRHQRVSGMKCTPGWSYLANTDSCYYYHNFTLDDANQIIKFTWTTAEKNCQQWGAHLVSLHSTTENKFIQDMIKTNLQLLYPNRKDLNFCMDFKDHAWIGLRTVNGSSSYTDGTYHNAYGLPVKDSQSAMCYEYNHGDITGSYAHSDLTSRQPRFICKKPAGK